MDLLAIFSTIPLIIGFVSKNKPLMIIGVMGITLYFIKFLAYWAMGW
ncbi:MAG: hypothetical protein P8J32_00645 [bacterium]|jgi:hypothetical protein|nr:hypothetical protein [bacterium]